MIILQGDRKRKHCIVLVYVHDILCAPKNETEKLTLYKKLHEQYVLEDKSYMKEYLGVQVNVDDDLIPIDQS